MGVEFWFEFASTYSYPAAMRVEALAAERGVAIEWRAFLLGPIFHAQGWNDSPFNIYPAKGRYMWRDLERICTRHDLPFRRPSQFPRNGVGAARIGACFADAAWLPDFVRAVYHANFGDDRDISDVGVVRDCLDSAGADADEVLALVTTPEGKARLRNNTETAQRLGIFGAPTFRVGEELFWGHDRMDEAFDWAQRRSAA